MPAFADEAPAVQQPAVDYLKYFSISAGLGISYSMLGLNFNYRPIEQLEFFIGKGTWGKSYGFSFYPSETYKMLHLTLSHNPNTIVDECWDSACDILQDGYSGYNAAIGIAPQHGKSGVELNVIYILTQENYADDVKEVQDNGYDIEQDKTKIKLSFGYRWNL